ncbi:hypothetical protein EPN96_04820 [bacterium]|nr:MAG: hypothetical protein EPN96_04820 [bacterium]
MNKELPEGWVKATLEELAIKPKADIVDGPFGSDMKASEYIESGVPIIRLQNIDRNRFIEKNTKFISSKKAEALARHSFIAGDIVISKLGEPLGKACIVPENIGAGIVVADVVRFRLNHSFLDPAFICFSINSPLVADSLIEHTKGSTRPRVNLGNIRRLSVPIPPLAEQKRVVAKVEVLLERVNTARERLASVPAILKRFRQSVLTAATSGKLTEDWRNQRKIGIDSWVKIYGSDVFNFITSGSRGWAKYYSNTGAIFLRVGNLDHNTINLDLSEIQRVKPPKGSEGERTRIKLDDILISITADVGMVALINHDIGEAYINQHLCLARPNNAYNSRYISYYLASPSGGLSQLTDAQRGATKVGLALGNIRSLEFSMPNYEEQHEIVRRIEALFALADAIEKRVADATRRVEKITQAILAKAFSGELVATEAELARQEGRTFEPASALLGRIKTQRALAAPAQKSRAPKRAKPQPAAKTPAPASGATGVVPQRTPATAKPFADQVTGGIPRQILDSMKPDVSYSRADLLAATGITETDWLWAVKQLKQSAQVTQTGDRRGARYSLSIATKSNLVEISKPAIHNRHAGNDMFNKAALCAYIVKSCHDPRYPLGRVKLAKLFYLAQHKADIHLTKSFEKLAAGPLDVGIFKVLNLAQKQGWLVLEEAIGKLKPVSPGKKIDEALPQAEKILGDSKSRVDEMLSFMKKLGWKALERWATVLEAALELIQLNRPVNVSTVKEVLINNEKWRAKLDREEFADNHIRDTISGLKNHGFLQ